ncbi:helix-turn-helix transcriptional regulator [Endozoicomonas sp. G2_1]|uniref:helix-turn-helix domain-containing protein n=1 Tax=Endozoicomonas sp. G2_1 TaxID=2821091 RepID=UPI001ADBFBEA|nr:helix-turn-helix transcriptional regulator [Endozoicomonas sp. G2_1]MBO9492279.1 helix-turn-helix transcriptional regulator [Endozoicomonas sp. G2_1]
MPKKFSTRLQTLLKERKISISELSRSSQFSRQAIYNWMATDHISKTALHRVAQVLGVTPEWLRYGERTNVHEQNVKRAQQSPFIKLLENKDFAEAKKHLDQLNILVGRYLFVDNKISYYNSPNIYSSMKVVLPLTPSSFFELLPKQQHFSLKRNYLKVLKREFEHNVLLSINSSRFIINTTMAPLFDYSGLIEGISFRVQPFTASVSQLEDYFRIKCKACQYRYNKP